MQSKNPVLTRFITAQENTYDTALAEIRAGRKRSHWMWYIFPQMLGLGRSSMSEYYGITGVVEARAYLADAVLGARLVEISTALLELPTNDAHEVFGSPDDMKLKSSMTLFYLAGGGPVFRAVLDKFFGGDVDAATLRLLEDEGAGIK
jgi:uncharacterized protein (DUF1810 family)